MTVCSAPGDEHGVLGDIPGDGGPGGGVGAGPDGDGGDEIGIAAEESAIADGGAELFLAVKIGDGHAAAEIHPAAAVGIADIGEVGNGGLLANMGVFDLHEVADFAPRGDVAAGADLRKRPDGDILLQGGFGDIGIFNSAVFADDGIGEDTAGADDRAGGDGGIAPQDAAWPGWWAPGATRTVSSMRMPSHRGMETPEASSAVSSASRAGSVLGMGILLF